MTLRFAVMFALALCFSQVDRAFGVQEPASTTQQQSKSRKQKNNKKKKQEEFKWNHPSTKWLEKKLPNVTHGEFDSLLAKTKVGYCIYLPPEYDAETVKDKRFPVVYYLHGGRPGNEWKSAKLSEYVHEHIVAGDVAPMIYVFVNGGPVSHYNVPARPEVNGADVFIKELIPHIDKTYRTIASRDGRGLEGFSQGGRGTGRLMFRYPELFCSASPGGGGHATEKRISENGGKENTNLIFAEGDNTWDLAAAYAEAIRKDSKAPTLKILVHVGDEGFNYQNNLLWMNHLKSLDIEHQSLIVSGVGHNAQQIYQQNGLDIMKFHATNFGL